MSEALSIAGDLSSLFCLGRHSLNLPAFLVLWVCNCECGGIFLTACSGWVVWEVTFTWEQSNSPPMCPRRWGILSVCKVKLPSLAGRSSWHLEKRNEASDGSLGASLSCALQIQQGEGDANEKLFGSKPLLLVCGLLVWLKINFPVVTLRVTVLWRNWVLFSGAAKVRLKSVICV